MRALFFTIVFIAAFFLRGKAQAAIEAQLGGVNYIGLSVNYGYEIALSKNRQHLLMPSAGIGVILPPTFKGLAIFNLALQYRYKGWGIGAQVGSFLPDGKVPFMEMLIYPNISHTVDGKRGLYYRMSMGTCLSYSRINTFAPFYIYGDPGPLRFRDIIPGASLAIGIRLRQPGPK